MPYFFKISDYFVLHNDLFGLYNDKHRRNYDLNYTWKKDVTFAAGMVKIECKKRDFDKAFGILFIPNNNPQDIKKHALKFEYISTQTINISSYTIIDLKKDFFKQIEDYITEYYPDSYDNVYLHFTCEPFIQGILENGFLQSPPQTLLNFFEEDEVVPYEVMPGDDELFMGLRFSPPPSPEREPESPSPGEKRGRTGGKKTRSKGKKTRSKSQKKYRTRRTRR